jgi:hypothetical protein
MLTSQGTVIASLIFMGEYTASLLIIAAMLIGFNFGSNLSLFPSATKDFYGLKNFGVNYGLLFSAWGAGGFLFPRVSQMIAASIGTNEAV